MTQLWDQRSTGQFKNKLQAACPDFAYQLLILQIIVEDDHYQRKPTIQQITRLIQLYMLAVEILQSACDDRFHYFNRKIQSLMMKKHIVQQLYVASTGKQPDNKLMEQANKAEMEVKKGQHQMQMYFHQGQVDIKKIQQMLKKSDVQVTNFEVKVRTNIHRQQKTLQERIKQRKLRSQSGSNSKFKLGSKPDKNGFNVKPIQTGRQARMQYFMDCNDKDQFEPSNKNIAKQKRNTGSLQKFGQVKRSKLPPTNNKFI